MKTDFKTKDQIEFAELLSQLEGLYGKKGLKAFVARELKVSPPAISMYLAGKSNPSEIRLSLLRELLARFVAARLQGQRIEEKFSSMDRLREQLEFLEQADPPSFEAARVTIDALHKNVSSKPLSEDEDRALSGATAAKNLAQLRAEYGKKRKAASPTENKSGPGDAGPSNPK